MSPNREDDRTTIQFVNSLGYKTAVLLHVLAVVVGFGSLVLDAVYAGQVRRFSGAEAQAVASAHYTATTKFGEGFLYSLPIFGIVAIATSAGAVALHDFWVWASLVVYLATVAALHGLVKPARRRSLVLLGELTGSRDTGRERPVEMKELARLGQRLSVGSGLINVLLFAALILMVFKPGNR